MRWVQISGVADPAARVAPWVACDGVPSLCCRNRARRIPPAARAFAIRPQCFEHPSRPGEAVGLPDASPSVPVTRSPVVAPLISQRRADSVSSHLGGGSCGGLTWTKRESTRESPQQIVRGLLESYVTRSTSVTGGLASHEASVRPKTPPDHHEPRSCSSGNAVPGSGRGGSSGSACCVRSPTRRGGPCGSGGRRPCGRA